MNLHVWKAVGRGILIGVTYCFTFLVMWRHSIDQWYLPAGLRLTCLLLMPMRYWPCVLAGDAAALLSIRAPKAEQYSPQWAYFSPFLFAILYVVVPLYVRKKFNDSLLIVKWIPLIAIAASIWSIIVGRLINIVLDGPTPQFGMEKFVRYFIGDFLGILMVMLPCLLWQQRHEWRNTRRHIVQTLTMSVLMVGALYGAAMVSGNTGMEVRLLPLVFMLLPLAYLTTLHGWHGAAVGTLLVNLAIALALPQTNSIGAADPVTLIAQTALAATSAGLLAGGVRISSLHERSGESLRSELLAMQLQQQQEDSETHTMGAVRSMFLSFEQRFREKALLLAYARDDLDAYRNAVAQTLKDEGLYRQAMDAIAAGVESSRALVRHSELLYPFEIETYGLHAVLLSEYFQDRWDGRVRLQCVLPGPSSKQPPLSLPLQLAAYRAICSAMTILTAMAPAEYTLRTRQWQRSGRKGITVFIDCSPTTAFALTPDVQHALQELAMLARAYDGTFQHRHTHRIGFLVSEPQPTP